MKKEKLNFLVDFLSFVNTLIIAITGFILKYAIPHGPGRKTFLLITGHQWGDIHFYTAIIFIILMVIHFYLHWSWIKCMVNKCIVDIFFKDFKEK